MTNGRGDDDMLPAAIRGNIGASGSTLPADRQRRDRAEAGPRSDDVAAPIPTLPKGGGAIRDIGEKFSANPVTGTAKLEILIAVSPGRAGFQPALALEYDSGAGNGPFGHGFQLSIPQIARKTDKGLPTYDDANDADTFILSGAEDLIPKRLETAGGQKEEFDDGTDFVERYIPRVEGQFARIEKRQEKATGVVYWQATTKENVVSTYGRSEPARVAHPEYPRLVFSWLLEETRDDRGNVIVYEYKEEDLANVASGAPWEANRLNGGSPVMGRYLKRIRYGNTVPFDQTPALGSAVFEIVFDYGEHTSGAPTEDRPWLCRIDPFSTYRAGFERRTYRLCRRALVFHRMKELGDAPCLVRSTEFAYRDDPALTKLASVTHAAYLRDPQTGTLDRDALPPLELEYSEPEIHSDVLTLDPASTLDLPEGVENAYQWVDLDGEGLPGVLSRQGEALFYKQNMGAGSLASARPLLSRPSLVEFGGVERVTDLDGDGLKEIAIFAAPAAGYFDRTIDGDFEPFRPFAAQAFVDWTDPNLRLLDLNGDGYDDVLIARADTFVWYPSLAKGGFDSPITLHKPKDDEKGAALVFADATLTIFLADMSGDGLTDLVRIRNGSVCYWPNLGFGRFGPKVQMGGETWFDHPESFDPRRIRLTDVDGSGTTDIIYLREDGPRIYSNQAGNAFGPAVVLPTFPDASDHSSIAVVDLLGAGTACLVWSSSLPGEAFRPMRYVDLLGGTKPHLLTSYRNNLGLEVELEYAPSTEFYLADAARGEPWITRLPFPVHVLTRAQTTDSVSRHRFVSTYSYHHGYFDGIEREFRGFGMVEQWDTESFSRFSGSGELPPPANATDPEFHLPPVHVKTWFHTGAWEKTDVIASGYARQYYGGDPLALALSPALLPPGVSADDRREAYRALKGQILRQETYADDESPEAAHPYVVSERSYEVRCLQPIGEATHGAYFVHPREAVEYHYERNPSDPRVRHELTLEVDAYGAVRRSAVIGYPRRAAYAAYDEQKSVAITLVEADVVHHAPEMQSGYYRLGVPIESRGFELTGVVPPVDALFSFDTVLAAANAATAIAYEATPDGAPRKRFLSETRTLYSKDDGPVALPLGQIESLALPYQSYSKAFTPALVDDVFGNRVTGAVLAEGGYVQLDGDTDWWVPSARQLFAPEQFYLPVSFLDPFGTATDIAYDDYRLMIVRATDAVGNVVTAEHDYGVLLPRLVTDPNGNRTAARFDAFGRVLATAVMGKEGANEGDTLDDPTATFEYDLVQVPAMIHARAREQHGAANTRWQESYSYTDGSGHEVMRKVQAEPGPVPERGPDGKLVRNDDGTFATVPADPRWVGTGRTVLDNKGNPVKQYEPYFSSTQDYEDEPDIVEWGVTPILHYDPVGRLVRTDLPNGTFSEVTFDPWQETHSDPNDTVLESAWYADRQKPSASDQEKRAAQLTAAHAHTPAISHLDSLGRAVRKLEDNGTAGVYETRVELDIEGNPLSIIDARGIEAVRHRFAMGGRKLREKNSDAGERWTLADVKGAPFRAWDARGFSRRLRYDALRRPTHLYVTPPGAAEFLAERSVYGEALGDAAVATNHRGRVYQHYDGAGVVTAVRYDFKGNLGENTRRLAKEYKGSPDWVVTAAIDDAPAVASAAEPLLEAENFTTSTVYDALNRPTSITTPDQSETRPGYNEAGLLDRVDARVRGGAAWTPFVENIDYDEKGQRQQIVYGGTAGKRTTTEYAYDPLTFRLLSLATTRESDGAALQLLRYTYDPVGNITEIRDDAQQTVFFGNAVVTPSTAYVYDAIYRLTEASGRELAGGAADVQRDDSELPLQNLPHANDLQALRRYTESYGYDAVGNILQMVHDSGAAPTSWTRRYQIDSASNRLLATSVPGDDATTYSAKYVYDAHGNMASMPHLQTIGWDYADRMISADKGGGGIVYFTYDAAGQRVRKVWEHAGLVEERVYVGGAWEVYRKYNASDRTTPLFARETLHVMDGERRIALVETNTADTSGAGAFQPTTVTRFQLGNHLGSAVLEIDDSSRVISYEEYHPYGTTSYASATGAAEVSRKRYRYTGKEKDEETGLYYHGARYYAPWLGRWTAADPIGIGDGLNLYTYCHDRPTVSFDPTGQDDEYPWQAAEASRFEMVKAYPRISFVPGASKFQTASQGELMSATAQMARQIQGEWKESFGLAVEVRASASVVSITLSSRAESRRAVSDLEKTLEARFQKEGVPADQLQARVSEAKKAAQTVREYIRMQMLDDVEIEVQNAYNERWGDNSRKDLVGFRTQDKVMGLVQDRLVNPFTFAVVQPDGSVGPAMVASSKAAGSTLSAGLQLLHELEHFGGDHIGGTPVDSNGPERSITKDVDQFAKKLPGLLPRAGYGSAPGRKEPLGSTTQNWVLWPDLDVLRSGRLKKMLTPAEVTKIPLGRVPGEYFE